MKNLSLTTVVGWGITIIIAAMGGTFALTKYSNEQAIKALEQRLAIAEQQSKPRASPIRPTKKAPSDLNNQEFSELTSRLEKLENEKRVLIDKISKKAVLILDPRSELSTLLAQLESNSEDERAKAVSGLFMLKDPVSFTPLLKYFETHPKEATEGSNPFIGNWFRFFIEVGGTQGIEYVASQLESTERFWSELAFNNIKSEVNTIQSVEITIPVLENIAVSSSSSLARTRSKVLIQHLQDNRVKIAKEEKVNKSEGVPNNLIIWSALNRNGLSRVTAKMLTDGTDFLYWKTGLYIAQEFIEKPEYQENCVAAIKELIAPGTQIAASSRCLLLYLLAKMEESRGNDSIANKYAESCREESPELYEYLIEHNDVFDLKMIHSLFKIKEDNK